MATPMEVHGLKKTQARLTKALKDLDGAPIQNKMRDATLIVQRDARVKSPVFFGELRASILPEVRSQGDTVVGVVGSNTSYAPFMELGTRPHWPPLAALETWARRHGISAYLVARSISRRGLKARRFLQRAFENNIERIKQKLGEGVSIIVKEANGG